jgi:uncharacterized membrane protein (UPF0127 family)
LAGVGSRAAGQAGGVKPGVEKSGGLRQTGGVKWINLFVLCLGAVWLPGCMKSAPPPLSAPAAHHLPTQAQPKLRTMKLYLGAEALDAELALSPDEEETGMMFRTNILDTDAMLFDLHYPMRASFWMTNCPESISAAYITPDGIIAEIHHLEKNDATPVVANTDNIQFVLETSEGWFARHNVSTGMVVKTERGSLSATFQGR